MKKAKVRRKVTYAPFEVADYLESEEAIAEFLSLAARDENPGVLLKALGDVAHARHGGSREGVRSGPGKPLQDAGAANYGARNSRSQLSAP